MLAEVHILKSMYIYKKGSPSNISIFPDMYGYVGGKKEGRQYPTVANVREKFYEMHKDAARDPDPELGQIPLVQHSTFRLCFDPDPQLSGALVTNNPSNYCFNLEIVSNNSIPSLKLLTGCP